MKIIHLILLMTLLTGCGGTVYSGGNPYEEIKPDPDHGRIIAYLSEDTVLSGLSSPSIQINNDKPSIISRGGYHDYKAQPGLYIIRYNPGMSNEQAMMIDIKQGEIIYIRCAKDIKQSKIIRELHKTRKQFSPESPITPLDLRGKTLISKSNPSTRISIKNASSAEQAGASDLYPGNYDITVAHEVFVTQPTQSLIEVLFVKNDGTIVSSGPNTINLEAKENCAYIINTIRPSNTSIKFTTSEYCIAKRDENKLKVSPL